MESQPQNPEFSIDPENFHPWKYEKNAQPAMSYLLYFRPT